MHLEVLVLVLVLVLLVLVRRMDRLYHGARWRRSARQINRGGGG
jgi:hypothetical protein